MKSKKKLEIKYNHLQKQLKSKVDNLSLTSFEVVEVSQKIDEYIVRAMKELNSID